jgi:Na+/proline symporter
MELDELKSEWAKIDKKLSDNLKLNEDLLEKITLSKSKEEMKEILNNEILGVVIISLLLLLFGVVTCSFISEMKFFIPGVFLSLFSFMELIMSITKVNDLTKIDYFNSPVVELQKALNKFKQKTMLFRNIEYNLFPLFVISFIPIFNKTVLNFDMFKNTFPNIIGIIVGIIVGLAIYYPLAIWIYKIAYDSKIKSASDFLKELNKFEKEE